MPIFLHPSILFRGYTIPAFRQGLICVLFPQEQYFVIHAARQSGKTTLLQELTRQVSAEKRYHALYCSLESLERVAEPEQGIPAIVKKFTAQISRHPALHHSSFAQDADYTDFTNVLNTSLSWFCESLVRQMKPGVSCRV